MLSKLLVLILAVQLICSPFAQANSQIPTSDFSSYIGSGILDIQTNQIIYLQCLDSNKSECNQFQFRLAQLSASSTARKSGSFDESGQHLNLGPVLDRKQVDIIQEEIFKQNEFQKKYAENKKLPGMVFTSLSWTGKRPDGKSGKYPTLGPTVNTLTIFSAAVTGGALHSKWEKELKAAVQTPELVVPDFELDLSLAGPAPVNPEMPIQPSIPVAPNAPDASQYTNATPFQLVDSPNYYYGQWYDQANNIMNCYTNTFSNNGIGKMVHDLNLVEYAQFLDVTKVRNIDIAGYMQPVYFVPGQFQTFVISNISNSGPSKWDLAIINNTPIRTLEDAIQFFSQNQNLISSYPRLSAQWDALYRSDYNLAQTIYQYQLNDYNSDLANYNTLLSNYNIAFQNYQIALTAYEQALAQYNQIKETLTAEQRAAYEAQIAALKAAYEEQLALSKAEAERKRKEVREKQKWMWIGIAAGVGVTIATPMLMDMFSNIIQAAKRDQYKRKAKKLDQGMKQAWEELVFGESNQTMDLALVKRIDHDVFQTILRTIKINTGSTTSVGSK